MKSVRNTPFSQSGLGNHTLESRSPQPWYRIRQAVDGYAAAIVRIIGESYGKETVQLAWREFTIGDGGPFLGDDPNVELFFSWLFHRWSPRLGEGHHVDDDRCYGVPPTRAYLARNALGLDPLKRRYLEACLATRFSFYEILDCKPHIGFRVRDVLSGGAFEVNEGIASTSLQNGDIVFAHIVHIDDTAMMEAVSPYSFPSTLKPQFKGLPRPRKWDESQDLPLRRLYFKLVELHRRMSLPEVRNADGEVLAARSLYFDIECPRRAFDALAPLARGIPLQELLQMARIDASGKVSEVTIPWVCRMAQCAGHPKTALLGYIHIRGEKMIVDVNSAKRSKEFRRLISGVPEAAARYRGARKQQSHELLLSASEVDDLHATRH